MAEEPDFVVVHRDADNAGRESRRGEIEDAIIAAELEAKIIPVIPIRMTEAWILLDETSIRQVAGNPNGKNPLDLPTWKSAERLADPKQRLKESLLEASGATGRRRDQAARRFSQHRRQLLERLDRNGPVSKLAGWQNMVDDIRRTAHLLNVKS